MGYLLSLLLVGASIVALIAYFVMRRGAANPEALPEPASEKDIRVTHRVPIEANTEATRRLIDDLKQKDKD